MELPQQPDPNDPTDFIIPVFRFQNFQLEDYTYFYESLGGNNPWVFLPFNYPGSPDSLDMENSAIQLEIPNYSGREYALTPIRDFIYTNDGLRRSTVSIITLWDADVTFSPKVDIWMVSHTTIGETISITLQSPTSAVTAMVPSLYYARHTSLNGVPAFPELPIAAQGGFN